MGETRFQRAASKKNPSERVITDRCLASGCTVRVKKGKIMCAKHWVMVPFELQEHIFETHAVRADRIASILAGIRAVRDAEGKRGKRN